MGIDLMQVESKSVVWLDRIWEAIIENHIIQKRLLLRSLSWERNQFWLWNAKHTCRYRSIEDREAHWSEPDLLTTEY